MKGKPSKSSGGGPRKLVVQPLKNKVVPLLILQNPTPPKNSSSAYYNEQDAFATEGTFDRDEFMGYI